MTTALVQLQRIADAPSPEILWSLLLETMTQYGFDRVTYGFTRYHRAGNVGDTQDVLFLSNHGHETISDGLDMGFFMRTPMFRWVLQNTGACSWRWAEEQRDAGLLTSDEIAAMQHARDIGVRAGYSIGFSNLSPRARGAMGLTARQDITQDEIDAVWAARGEEVLAICNMFHLRVTHMPFRVQRRRLSQRQREALEWVADGKTTQDIAQIMSISAAMVEKHLRLAREALDVETTAHAVAKATLLNHIFSGPEITAQLNAR